MHMSLTWVLVAASWIHVAELSLAQDANAPEPSPTSAAAKHMQRCLEQASINYEYRPDRDLFWSSWQTHSWTDDDGDLSARILIDPDSKGDVVVSLPGAYDLSLCAHLAACRKVMTEAYWKAGLREVQFVYDPVDAEVRAVLHAPGQSGRIDAKQLRSLVESLLMAVDRVHPVMLKAMDTGNVDWPSDDRGPKQPELEFTATLGQSDPLEIGVAVWVEPEIFATTILSFEEFGKSLVDLNDEDAEALGAKLFERYRDGPLAWSVYRDWSAFWSWVKQHYPPIAVRIWGPPGLTVRGTLSCEGFLAKPCEAYATIDRSGTTEVNFSPEWSEDALLRLASPRKIPLRISIDVPDATMEPATVTLQSQPRMHPVGVAQLGMPLTLPVAMQVNEEHPWIDGLLREAKRTGVSSSLGSMSNSSPAEQVRQVFAVWKALRNRGITYSNIASAASAGQRVRSLHECIAGEQANCLDGVASLASLLKALDFDVNVVHVPGHTFLFVFLNPADDPESMPRWLAIETTVIGREFSEQEMRDVDLLDHVELSLRPSGELASDWRSFEAACVAGRAQFHEALQDRTLRMIPVSLLRDCGLRAIPSLRSEIGTLPDPPSLEAVVRERKKRDAIRDRERKRREAAESAPAQN